MKKRQPVIVVGCGHSGTRLFASAVEALGIHLGAGAHSSTELQERWFAQRITKIACKAVVRVREDTVPMMELARFKRSCGRLARLMSPNDEAWGWSLTETYLIPWHVQCVYPGARWLEILRDGRDVAFTEHLTDDPGRALGKILLRQLGALGDAHHLQAAKSWAYQVDRFAVFASRYPRLVHRVRFEDLLSDPDGVMGGVAGFLGVPMTDVCRELLGDSVKPDTAQQFREDRAELLREVEDAIGLALERYGYGGAGVGAASRASTL